MGVDSAGLGCVFPHKAADEGKVARKVRPDRSLKIIGEAMHLLTGSGPVEVALFVGNIAVE
jgi:hypothetical protein